MAQKGARKEQITGAYELWQQAKVQEEVMRKSFERVQKLYDQKVISAQKYDETKAKYDASVAQANAAKSQYDMACNGAREEDKQAAAALVERANGAMMEVEAYLGELYLTSPANGVISAIYPHAGELVGTGSPIMTVTDLADVWFTFNVREDYLHGMKQGDNFMAVRESYATWKATKETDAYDAKTFEVRAVPDVALEGLRPGMSVIVKQNK